MPAHPFPAKPHPTPALSPLTPPLLGDGGPGDGNEGNSWPRRRGVRASAGSGKTYDLTGHYLRALLTGADPANMLATTFTRKAAGEILGRVLRRLAQACQSKDELATLSADLSLPELTPSDARRHLARLSQSLHRVSISTIDSFFGKLLRGWRPELGLAGDIRVLDTASPEIARIRREAIASVLAGESQSELLELLTALQGGSATSRIASDLEKRMRDAHEVFQLTPAGAWPPATTATDILTSDQLDQAARELERACEDITHRGQLQAANKEWGLIAREDWDALFDKGLAAAIAQAETTYWRAPIPERVIRAYQPVIAHARAVVLADHAAHTQALLRLLSLFDQAYAERLAREGVMAFGDVPLALSALMPGLCPAEIGHRLDAQIDHLLLDEFQDTDPQQYAVLKPFADFIHALPQTNGLIYCVGDLKQSIYGWRGATPQIFERFGAGLPDVAWTDNDTSYRSAQPVLDSVNTLFGTLSQNAVLAKRHPETAQLWQSRFNAHVSMKPDLAGFVRLLQSKAEGEEDEHQTGGSTHLAYAARQVKAIADSAPWATVGVLMRSNDGVRRMIFQLGQLGVSASAVSAGPIAGDPAVGLVLSALAFADHPSDTAALFHVTNSPLAEILNFHGEREKFPSQVALEIRRQIAYEGFASTLTGWARTLAPACDAHSARRLSQLIELADTYDQHPQARILDFADFVRSQSVDEPEQSPVRVMTVHKSKGLEFDAVVLPELNMRLTRHPTLVYRRDPQTLAITQIACAPNEIVRKLSLDLAAMYQETMEHEVREALCLLYVAMTRARQALTLVVPALAARQDGTARSQGLTLAAIVRAGLAGTSALNDLELPEELWSHGDPLWHEKAPVSAPAAPVVEKPERSLPTISLAGQPMRIWRQITPSSLGDDGESAAELLGIDASEASRRRGVALHALLAQIEWAGDALPDKDTLWRVARAAQPSSSDSELAAYVEAFLRIMERPAVAKVLTKPALAEGERVEVWRERDFIQIVDGALVSGKFDRVALIWRGEAAVRAEIVDFKTAEIAGAGVPEWAARYAPQVGLYKKALCKMTGLTAKNVAARLVFTDSGIIEAV